MSEDKPKVRHMKKQACTVNTRYGEINLGANGEVLNFDDLGVSKKELCTLPNFVDASKFPGPAAREEVVQRATDEQDKREAAKAAVIDYAAIIQELKDAGAEETGEGYIQMETLNAALRERELPIITGMQRKEIEDAAKAAAAE